MTSGSNARKQREEKAAALRAQVEGKERRRRITIVLSAVTAVLVVVFGIVALIQYQTAKSALAIPAGGTPKNLSSNGILVGKSSAKVTVALYEDFYCPICKQFESANRAALAQYVADGKIKLIYHPVAILDRSTPDGSAYSPRAANIAAAVYTADPTKFQKFHDLLFDNQPEETKTDLSDTQLLGFATQAGVNKEAISAAVKDQQFKNWVTAGTDQASKDGLPGTPWVKINGTVFDWAKGNFTAAIDKALAG